jgi:hypothetical protein
MTIGRDSLSKMETVTVAALEAGDRQANGPGRLTHTRRDPDRADSGDKRHQAWRDKERPALVLKQEARAK